MKKIEYVIETLAPVTFAEKSNDSVMYTTKTYFPGSAVRGAIAQAYITSKNLQDAHLDETFYELFLAGKVRFLPAYPIGEEDSEKLNPTVIPLSIMRSKDGKSVVDISGDKTLNTGYKKLQGFAVMSQYGDCLRLAKVNVNVKTEFHMSRNSDSERITGSSKDGNVFNYEYIQPWQYFKGYLLADDECTEKLMQVLDKIKYLYFGRSKNAQYGKCSIRFTVKDVEICGPEKESEHVYLYALTPYIPYEDWNRVNDVAFNLFNDIEAKLKQKGIDVRINHNDVKLFTASEDIDGYVSVWQLKKAREKAVAAGSLIEFKYSADKDCLTQLQDVLLQGLGKGREDGFGQFRIWQAQEKISMEMLSYNNEKCVVCAAVQERCQKIMQDLILNEIKIKSVEDTSSDKLKLNRSSNSILKRVEHLMDSSKTKEQIQNEIRFDFKKTAQNNLRSIKLEWVSLYDLLTESDGAAVPYSGINWLQRLDITTAQAEEIKSITGNIFEVDKDVAYKTYWLWFCRHAVRIDKEEKK